MSYLIGIDIGTSGTKTLLINREGKVIASASREYPCLAPHPGWSEQEPTEWWQAVQATVRQVLEISGIASSEVAGVGLSGQMHGSVFLDADNQVIRPAILWNDQRTVAECDEITEKVGAKRLLATVANPALTGFTAPKILWLRNHEPENYQKVRKILLPKDYIRFMLTHEYATEVSDASGMLLLDIAQRDWSDEVLDKLEIDRKCLGKVYESPEITGRITAKASSATGLAEGTPVVGGAGDCAAFAIGSGVVRSGVIAVSLGTSGVVFAFSDTMETDPLGRAHTFCHAVSGKWHMMGVMLSAGGSFAWLRDTLGQEEVRQAAEISKDPYELLCALAEASSPGAEGLVFLPYLTGERTPHADPFARGVYAGLSPRHSKPHLVRATLEGITFGLRDSFEIFRELKVPVEEIRVTGGGARSPFWRGIQADIFRAPVCTLNAEEGPAYGVALLAAVGAGLYKSVEEACDATIQVTSTTDPDLKNADLYDRIFPVYQGLYQDLKGRFREIVKLASTL